jgi:hypothetical protein
VTVLLATGIFSLRGVPPEYQDETSQSYGQKKVLAEGTSWYFASLSLRGEYDFATDMRMQKIAHPQS